MDRLSSNELKLEASDAADPGSSEDESSGSEEVALERAFDNMLDKIKRTNGDAAQTSAASYLQYIHEVVGKLTSHCTWLPEKLVKGVGSKTKRFERYQSLLSIMLEKCPDFPKWKEEKYGETTMHIAMRKGHANLIRFLCERSASAVQALSKMTKYQINCLHIAIAEKLDPELVKYVISCLDKETVDSVGQDMNTSLHLAVDYAKCRPGQLEIVDCLLKISNKPLEKQNEFKPAQKDYHAGKKSPETLKLTPLQYHYYTRDQHRVASEPSNPENDKVADEIAALLRLHCLRLNLEREETLSLLYGSKKPNDITFDLWGYETVREEDLERLLHLNFETILQSVVLPELKIIPVPILQPEPLAQIEGTGVEKLLQLPSCPGRTDYCRIFRWLRKRGVQRILRVSVQDRVLGPHSDESIEWCLKEMDVEILNWNRLDICCTTIKAAAPNVRKLTLYSSGNNAALRSWADENGICTLPALQEVHVEIHQGLESRERTEYFASEFQKALMAQRKKFCEFVNTTRGANNTEPRPEPSIVVTYNCNWTDGSVSVPRSKTDLREGRSEKQDWLRCMEDFAKFIRNYDPPGLSPSLAVPYTKVAIIDDGVDGLYAGLGCDIADGKSFCTTRGDGNYDSFFKSSNGHGTLMAVLIRRICPNVKFYVARVNEERTGDDTREITAASAIKAIKWATEQKVDIISMSWTINDTGPQPTELNQLTEAINKAVEQNILLFCSVSDQGPRTEGRYPAACNRSNTFLIGAATVQGQGWQWLGKNEVDYIFPGTDLTIGTGDPLFDERSGSSSRKSRSESYSGSSLATALAAGLAALVLNCVALRSIADLSLVKTHLGMELAFGSINTGGGKEKYLRVWDLFEKKLKEQGEKGDAELLGEIVQRLLSHVRGSVPTVSAQ